jgi:hypothetical protein
MFFKSIGERVSTGAIAERAEVKFVRIIREGY